MLKVELHSHTADDPHDRIPHTAEQLIDRAASLGYHALAITLHDRQLDLDPLRASAAARGLVLIPGVERTLDGRHVLLLNFPPAAQHVASFADVEALKRDAPDGLVVAPHPFFPHSCCLRGRLEQHASVFDAVECNAMFTATLDFNERARRWAAANGKPVVGNGDVHRLHQLGTTYSLVDAAPDPASICRAIRAGRVTVVSRPLSWGTAARTMAGLYLPAFLDRGTAAPRLSYAGVKCSHDSSTTS